MTEAKSSSRICLPRWATPRNPERATLGHVARRVSEEFGTPLMPWQQEVADVALEITPDGKFWYREIGVTVPRQSGKTTLTLSILFTRALYRDRQNLRYTAQTGADARKKLIDDWLPVVENSSFFKRGLFHTRMTNGHEALKFSNGSHLGLLATTKKAGHGGTVDVFFLDEAFAQPDARLEQSQRPAMITRTDPGAQFWVVSTAGTPLDSPYLLQKVEQYRSIVEKNEDSKVAYFEYSADESEDPLDPNTWLRCMPALGHTQSIDTVRAESEGMELNEFERAFLNLWKDVASDPVIAMRIWDNLEDDTSEIDGKVCLSYDVTPDHSRGSIAAGGRRSDKKLHIEVTDNREGVDWIPDRLAEIASRNKVVSISCDPAGPAGALLPQLQRSRPKVETITATEYARSCGYLVERALHGDLVHIGQGELRKALNGAGRRELSDAWAWSRKNSAIDISPLVASTIALWAAGSRKAGSARVIDLNEVL